MATAQFYKKNNNGLTVDGMTQVVPVTPLPAYGYKQDGIYGYTPPVQPGGINKATGRPSTGVSSASSSGMIGGNAYNSMVAQNAAAHRPVSSYGASPSSGAGQNYANYMLATQQLPERLAALGVYGTGQAETSQIRLDSAYAQALDAYRKQQAASGANMTGTQIGGSANSQGMQSVVSGTAPNYRLVRGRDGGLSVLGFESSGGAYSPMNPAGHDLGQLADGSWYDYTLGVSYTDPNYMAYYNAYNAANPQGAAGTGDGSGDGTSGTKPKPWGYKDTGVGAKALSGSYADQLRYFGIDPTGLSQEQIAAIFANTGYIPTYFDENNPMAGMYLAGYPYYPNPVADFRMLDPKPVTKLPANYKTNTSTPIPNSPSPSPTPRK